MIAKIALRGLGHEYVNPFTRERVVALDGLELDVADGEFVTVVGPERLRQDARCSASWPAWSPPPAAACWWTAGR